MVRDLPFPHLNNSHMGHPSHKATARELAAKGSVLLKNSGVSCPLLRRNWAALLQLAEVLSGSEACVDQEAKAGGKRPRPLALQLLMPILCGEHTFSG